MGRRVRQLPCEPHHTQPSLHYISLVELKHHHDHRSHCYQLSQRNPEARTTRLCWACLGLALQTVVEAPPLKPTRDSCCRALDSRCKCSGTPLVPCIGRFQPVPAWPCANVVVSPFLDHANLHRPAIPSATLEDCLTHDGCASLVRSQGNTACGTRSLSIPYHVICWQVLEDTCTANARVHSQRCHVCCQAVAPGISLLSPRPSEHQPLPPPPLTATPSPYNSTCALLMALLQGLLRQRTNTKVTWQPELRLQGQ